VIERHSLPRSTPVAGSARDAFPRLLLGALASLCDGALVITLLFLVVVTGAGVVSRYLEGSPFAWTDEVAGYLFVALTFFGAASGFARNNHPRIAILTDRVPSRIAAALGAVSTGGTLSLLVVLVFYGYQASEQATGISMVSLPLSQVWGYAVIPVTSVAMAIFIVDHFLRDRPGVIEFLVAGATMASVYIVKAVPLQGAEIYAVLVVVLFVLLLCGMSVAFALAVTSLVILQSARMPLDIVPQRFFDGTSSVILLAIPLFMLTGTLMSSSGMATRLAAFATSIFGGIRGGLGIADVGASVIFADISGSAVADTAAIGSIMIPQLQKRGYSLEFASALQAAAGSLGLMFPPSSTMIVYAWITGVSVATLFMSSFLPGLMVAASFSLVIYIYARRRGYPRETNVGLRAFALTGWSAFAALMTPVLILVTILGGITTPSESGVIAAVYSALVGVFLYRGIKVRELPSILLEAALSASRVTLIIAAATLLSWVMTMFQGPQKVSEMLLGISHDPIVILILLNILMTILHTMLEGISTILVLVPVIMPLMKELHIDPIVFGIILAQNSALGLLFPPLGFNLYVISSMVGIPVERIAVAVLPFVAILCVDILLLIFLPQIATFLPSLMR
jgi:tripartite ATP-independent transporter DctM subunit